MKILTVLFVLKFLVIFLMIMSVDLLYHLFNTAGGDSVERNLDELHERIDKIKGLVDGISDALAQGAQQAEVGRSNITAAEDTIQRARDLLRVFNNY